MTLQDRIIEYRAKERISQTQLAERCGVAYRTLNLIEQGKLKPSKFTLAKIELVIGKETK